MFGFWIDIIFFDVGFFDIRPFDLGRKTLRIAMLWVPSPGDILSIRKDRGNIYLSALKNYSLNPTDSNRKILESKLRGYCKEISKLVPRSQRRTVNLEYGSIELLSSLAGSVSNITGVQNPETALYCAIFGSVCVLFPIFWTDYKKRENSKRKTPNSKQIEFNLKKTS